jgi:hypothetical protein
MVLSAFNLKQRQKGLEKYIEIYGIELLNKIAQDKKGVDILKMTTTDLGNLKKTLDTKGFKDFIITNQRLPNSSEATSLGHKFSEVRAAEKLKNPPRVPADTSPVYNKAEGYIYKRGGGGGNRGQVVYAKTKLGNQYTELNPRRSLEEVQEAINNAKKLEIPKGSGKFYLQNAKDLTGTSSKSSIEVITPREAEKYKGKLKFPSTGPKQVYDPTEGSKTRRKKINLTQDGELSVKGGREIRKNFGHVYPIIESYKPGTKITNIIDSKKNSKLIGFNKIGQKIAEEQEVIKNNYDFPLTGKSRSDMEILNGRARVNVRNAIEKLGPGYKGDIGYFLVNPETGEFTPKAGNYKNSIAGLEGPDKLYKGMTVDERKLVSEDIAKKARNLFLQEATVPGSSICDLPSVVKRKADGGRIAFANGSNCAIEVGEAFDKNPKGFAQEVNKLPEEAGAFNKVKNAASKFLNVAKKGGRFAAFAGVGAAAAGLVKEFRNDDPSTYLSNENQQKNMLIDMLTQPVSTPTETPSTAFGDAQLPAIGAVTAAGMVPGGAELYKQRTGAGSMKRPLGGPRLDAEGAKILKNRVSPFRALTGPMSGVFGKGLAATGTPLGMLALEPLYIGQQIADGASAGEIATNPLNYLGAAFTGPLSKEATRLAPKSVANFMRLGISPTALKTVSRRFGLPGLALSSGVSAYEMYQNKKAGRGLFDDG